MCRLGDAGVGVRGEGAADRGVSLDGVGDEPQALDVRRAGEVLARVPHGEGGLARIAARAPVEGHRCSLGRRRGHEVVAAHVRERRERLRAARDDAVVDQPQVCVPVLDEHAVDLLGVDQPAKQV